MTVSEKANRETTTATRPSPAQLAYLRCGLTQAGGKLPLFDSEGQIIPANLIRVCVRNGWAEPWFDNPIKPDWLVCKLTDKGREMVQNDQ